MNQVQEVTGFEPNLYRPKPSRASSLQHQDKGGSSSGMFAPPGLLEDHQSMGMSAASMSTDSGGMGGGGGGGMAHQEDDLLKAVSQLLQTSAPEVFSWFYFTCVYLVACLAFVFCHVECLLVRYLFGKKKLLTRY